MKKTSLLALCLLTFLVACSDSNDSKPVVDLTPLLQQYILSSEDSVPEGVAFDSVDRAFYVTSLQGGSITRIDADGQESIFREPDSRAQLVGTKVDETNRRLWVCARLVDGIDNRVWVFDLGTGEMTMEFLLGALATDGSCNDLALDNAGTAYVSDSANPNIYQLDPDTGEGSLLVTDPLFADITTLGLGLNGIIVTPDDSALLVAKFVPASIIYVSLPGGGAVKPIALTSAIPSPDGLAILDGRLYSASGNSVSQISLSDDYTTGDVITVPQISGLSTATVAESELYVVKSDVTNFVLGLPLNTPFEIFKVDRSAFDQ
ncbi:MAG: sugar lactone lactonase YvrE [Halioglobus sp.]|jgi:sugar lactone lactonase YvrE